MDKSQLISKDVVPLNALEATKEDSESKRKLLATLKSEFGYLDELKVKIVEDKVLLGDESGPSIVESYIEEQEFVRVWLRQFALGNSIGINYFKLGEWNELSQRGLKAVMVISNEGDNPTPLFLVPPLITTHLGERERQLLRMANSRAYSNSLDPSKEKDLTSNLGVADKITEELSKLKQLTYQDLIPQWFFEKHDIIPEVEKQVHYIKDIINGGVDITSKLAETKDILKALYNKEKISKEEKEFLLEITKNEFVVDEALVVDKVTREKQEGVTKLVPVDNDDPFEC